MNKKNFFKLLLSIFFIFIGMQSKNNVEASMTNKVNSYIVNNKIKNPTISYQYERLENNLSSSASQMVYETSNQKPIGIVIHETANDSSTIENEINYMSNNWFNAFVHAFADADNIIEIHPSNFYSWGAGKYANPKFVQIELCRSKNFNDFAKSVNNQAFYAAYQLKKYGLKPTNASSTGKGTVWSHDAVSKFLGGTNHGDPVAYFKSFGYTFNDFFSLVKYKYDNFTYNVVTSYKNVKDYTGIIENITSSYGVYTKGPYATSDETKSPNFSISNLQNKKVTITHEALTERGLYYRIKYDSSYGWVNEKAVNIYDKLITKKAVNYTGYMKTSKDTIRLYSEPYFTSAKSRYAKEYGNSYSNQAVQVIEEATTSRGSIKWWHVKINGVDKGWVDSKYVQCYDQLTAQRAVNYTGYMKTSKDTIRLYSEPYFTSAKSRYAKEYGNSYSNQAVQVIEEATTSRGSIKWWHVKINGVDKGWVDSKYVQCYDQLTAQKAVNYTGYMKTSKDTIRLYSEPYFTSAKSRYAKEYGNSYSNQAVQVIEEATTSRGSIKWWHVKINGVDKGWVDSKYVQCYDQLTAQRAVNYTGYMKTSKDTIRLYSEPYFTSAKSRYAKEYGNSYSNQAVQVIEEATTSRGSIKWWHVKINGVDKGWVDSKYVQCYDQLTAQKAVNYTGYMKTSKDTIRLYSEPYFTSAKSRYAKEYGNSYSNQAVQVIEEATTSRGTTKWWHIKINDVDKGWIEKNFIEV